MKRSAVILVVSLATLVAVLLWLRGHLRRVPLEFTSVAWRTATVEERDRYSAHLAESGCLLGLREEKVVEMLGEPDHVDQWLVYHLEGATRGSPRSPAALVINLNGDGTVTRVVACGFADWGSSDVPFDAEGWRVGRGGDRAAMALNIIRTGALDGKTAAEVMRLLGKPTRTSRTRFVYYGRRYDDNGHQAMRVSGKKLFITLAEGRVTEVAYTGS